MPGVYEHLDVLAERFAHLDEATTRRALAQEGGHGGKAAKLLNDERFIMEEAEILENMMSFTGAEKEVCLAALDEFGSMDEAVMHLFDGWTPPPATTTNDLPTDLWVTRPAPSPSSTQIESGAAGESSSVGDAGEPSSATVSSCPGRTQALQQQHQDFKIIQNLMKRFPTAPIAEIERLLAFNPEQGGTVGKLLRGLGYDDQLEDQLKEGKMESLLSWSDGQWDQTACAAALQKRNFNVDDAKCELLGVSAYDDDILSSLPTDVWDADDLDDVQPDIEQSAAGKKSHELGFRNPTANNCAFDVCCAVLCAVLSPASLLHHSIYLRCAAYSTTIDRCGRLSGWCCWARGLPHGLSPS